MATPSLFPVFLKAQSGGNGETIYIPVLEEVEVLPFEDTIVDASFNSVTVDAELSTEIEIEAELSDEAVDACIVDNEVTAE